MLVSWSWEWASCTIFSRAVVDWNRACNRMVHRFLDNFDIQCESKGKNLSSHMLARELGVVA